MISLVSFLLDGELHAIDFAAPSAPSPTMSVLHYLRSLPRHKGVKEGCGEGDCGACTVVLAEPDSAGRLRYMSADSCLMFLPMLHGKQLITVENLRKPSGELHPVQKALVDMHGTQCGFCTPGIVMSIFALFKNFADRGAVKDALSGNLCRCTGYRTIIEAARAACTGGGADHFTEGEQAVLAMLRSISRDSLLLQAAGQTYYRPTTLMEALALVEAHPDAVIVNGATDCALRVTKKHELLEEIIDLSGLSELKEITSDEAAMTIGAGIVLNDVRAAVRTDFPALTRMLSLFGSYQIRNLATLGGNVGTASPIGDMLPVLIALSAEVVLQSVVGTRVIPIDHFFTGYRKTARLADELIVAVRIPKPRPHELVRSYKISRRRDVDISSVSAGFSLTLGEGREVETITLAYGGMAERVKRAEKTEQFLTGRTWERATVEEAVKILGSEFDPISDVRGSARMRSVAARNLLLKFWMETAGEQ